LKENLKKQGMQKKKGKIINYIAPSLLIRHLPTSIEYTVKKISFKNKSPEIIAYRYSGKKENSEKVYIVIPEKDFDKYEPV
tara:strand:- start:359 stop:601 length:243 start_codon:yes stop_codon:yes gene_type:complete